MVRYIMGPSPLLVVLALSRYALSFQTLKTSLKPVKLIDDSSAKAHFCSGRKHIYAPGVALLFSQKNDQEPRIPFFARTINKLRRKKEVNNDDTTNVSLPSFHDDVETPGAVSETKTVESEAALLRATAEKMRLEARKMDLALTLSKIDKLEKKLSGIRNHPDWRSNILSETQSLIQKLNPSTPATNIGAALAVDKVSNETTVANTSFSNETTAISNEELQQRIEDFLNGSSEERLNLAYSAGFADESNATAIVLKLYEYEQKNKQQKNMIQAIKDGTTPMLSVEKRDDAIQGFEKMPQQIKDMMAKTVGMKDGKNATAVIDKLMEENRLYDDEENDQFSMVAKKDDLDDYLEDLEFAEINSFVQSLLPEVTRKDFVNEEHVNAFYSEILGMDTFNPSGKPEPIAGGFLVRGESKVKSKEGKDDGDVLIEILDEKFAKSSIHGKLQFYYILDPTPPTGEDIMNDADELPLILITNLDVTPSTDAWVKPSITFLGLASIAAFALGSFSYNDEILNKISSSADSLDGDLSWFYDLSTPLALSLLCIQLAHELGHLVVALKDGIKVGLPTLVPGIQFGLNGAITPIEAPPKNIKSLFDFALAGPLLGITMSLILLYIGLENTVFMDASAREQLPSIPIEILRSSTLGGGIIEYLLGDGLLNSPDPAATVNLHPYAIAGFGGLITNALSLLPIGNTDGGRICLAFFGRSFSRVVHGSTLIILAISGLFGADESNILLGYLLFCYWQKEPEIPCRNEVTELDTVRGFLAIGMSLLVMLTLVPL